MVDVFSAGVILFIMVSGMFPFEEATNKDRVYKTIAASYASEFWKHHSKSGIEFSEELMDLIQSMI